MADVLGEILAFAIGIAISPIAIIAVILMLFSGRARVNGPMFLLGWAAGITTLTVVVLLLSNAGDVSSDSGASNGVSWLKLVLGIVLIALAVREWRSLPPDGEHAAMPRWMTTVDRFTPTRALAVGVALSALNPKNFVLVIGGATTISQGDLSAGKQVLAVAIFVVLSSLSVAAPVVAYFVGGQRAQRLLQRWEDSLARNNTAVMSVVLLIMGVVLIGKGFGIFD
jgi:threonine/homoserine/homoserine lactone efflux protein